MFFAPPTAGPFPPAGILLTLMIRPLTEDSMAKKPKTESVLSQQTRLKAEVDAIEAARAEEVTRQAAEQAAAAAKEAERKAVTPKPPRPPKVKKARFVREQKEKAQAAKEAVPIPRSTKAAGKLMTKNLVEVPKDEAKPGTRRPTPGSGTNPHPRDEESRQQS